MRTLLSTCCLTLVSVALCFSASATTLKNTRGWHEFLQLNPSIDLQHNVDATLQQLIDSQRPSGAQLQNCSFKIYKKVKIANLTEPSIIVPSPKKEICQWGCGNKQTPHFIAFDYEYLQNTLEQFKKLGVQAGVKLITWNQDAPVLATPLHKTRFYRGIVDSIASVRRENKYSDPNFVPDYHWLSAITLQYASHEEVNDDHYHYDYEFVVPGGLVRPGERITFYDAIDPQSIACIFKNSTTRNFSYWAQLSSQALQKTMQSENIAYANQFIDTYNQSHPYPFSNRGYQFLGSTMKARFSTHFSQLDFYDVVKNAFGKTLKQATTPTLTWSVCDWTAPVQTLKVLLLPGQLPEDALSQELKNNDLIFNARVRINPNQYASYSVVSSMSAEQMQDPAQAQNFILALTDLITDYPNAKIILNQTLQDQTGMIHKLQAPSVDVKNLEPQVYAQLVEVKGTESTGELQLDRVQVKIYNCR